MRAMMQRLREVGAHGLAAEMALRALWEAIGMRIETETPRSYRDVAFVCGMQSHHRHIVDTQRGGRD
jgi:hypothetical protein